MKFRDETLQNPKARKRPSKPSQMVALSSKKCWTQTNKLVDKGLQDWQQTKKVSLITGDIHVILKYLFIINIQYKT